jgi:hypothetical protein
MRSTDCRAASGGLATRTVVAKHGPHPARKLAPEPWLVTALVTETGGEQAGQAGTDRDDGLAFPEVKRHQDDQGALDGTSGWRLVTQRCLVVQP